MKVALSLFMGLKYPKSSINTTYMVLCQSGKYYELKKTLRLKKWTLAVLTQHNSIWIIIIAVSFDDYT